MKNIRLIVIIWAVFLVTGGFAQAKYEATNSAPGEFARMGFLPRGISLGNALSAVTTGNVVPFYNPAVSVYQESNDFQAGYTFLTLDRHLNYISFNRKFDFYSRKDSNQAVRKPRATAGICAGIINSGVSNIEERDNDGVKSGDLSTSENLFFVAAGSKISQKVAIGLTVKIYYYKLYEKMTSTATAFDLGALYNITENLKMSLVISDINGQYKWDSSPIYNTQGASTMDKFPLAKKIGLSYQHYFSDISYIMPVAEFESNSYGRKLLRGGVEFQYRPEIVFRGGFDNIVLSPSDDIPEFSAGFAFLQPVGSMTLGLEYGMTIEPYGHSSRHVVGLSWLF